MKDYDYHSLFYYRILAQLQDFRDTDGSRIKAPKEMKDYSVRIAYLPFPVSRFPHHYLRDQFIAERDKLVVFQADGDNVVLMRVNRFKDEAVVYKKALRKVFKNNIVVARRELTALMGKFYTLTEADLSGLELADFGDDPSYRAYEAVDQGLRQKKDSKKTAFTTQAVNGTTVSFVPW